MNLQTFKAPTMVEALSQVKKTMGHDAVILHTKTYAVRTWLGLRKREVVEITAGQGLNVGPRRKIAPTPARQIENATYSKSAGLPSDRREGLPFAASPPGRELMATAAANNIMMVSLSKELSGLKDEMRHLVHQVRQQGGPAVPEDLFNHYRGLIENEVAEELAQDILTKLQQTVRPEYFTQPTFIREKIAEQLEKLLPTSGPIQKTKKVGPHVVALIGPTGVGKTTTIAKLAANLKLRDRQKVGLITLDTYRIAAVDQLKKYADIIGSPLRAVGTPGDLKDAVASMSDCDYILIDTAGRSPNDSLKLGELKTFLAAVNPDEVHLVLSSTGSQECVELAISKFNDVRVDKIIFTKLDEAAHVGVVLNVIKKVNKSLSYITTGQDVPDDIEVGKGRKLAQLILGTQQDNSMTATEPDRAGPVVSRARKQQ
jgi:flagellar biosynthesis protein FlhF